MVTKGCGIRHSLRRARIVADGAEARQNQDSPHSLEQRRPYPDGVETESPISVYVVDRICTGAGIPTAGRCEHGALSVVGLQQLRLPQASAQVCVAQIISDPPDDLVDAGFVLGGEFVLSTHSVEPGERGMNIPD